MLSGIYNACRYHNAGKALLNKCVEDPRLQPSGMTPLFNNGGFTLIELLVVVLIIGILAAVAVPQYQKAVYKSRATEAMMMLKAIGEAQEVYYLANNEYTNDISKLDVEIPSDLITTESGIFPENSYKYACTTNYCVALTQNVSMPFFQIHNQHIDSPAKGKFFCHLGSGNTKNETAKAICQNMGTVFTGWDQYSWAKGKYFIIN